MRWFRGKQRKPGWLCVNLMPDRIDVSHVQIIAGRARPEVLLCDSYRKEGDDATALKRLARLLDIERYRVTTLLRPGEYHLIQVDAPNVPDAEIKGAVRWRVKDFIDFPVERATVDAIKIPAGGGRGQQVFAVVARNETIAATVAPFNDAEIPLEVVDVPELAQRNLAHALEDEGRAVVLLAFTEEGGLVTFTCDGELYQSRRIDVPLAALGAHEEAQRGQACERLVLELQRSLDHFDRQFSRLAVSKIVVAPVPGAPGPKDDLAANLNVPVVALDVTQVLECVQVPDLTEPARQQQCLQLIGAAMRMEGAIA